MTSVRLALDAEQRKIDTTQAMQILLSAAREVSKLNSKV